jgi:tetratricopeptide (TPR) repeat protein
MRRFAKGDAVVDKGISFSPDWWPYLTLKAWAAIEKGSNVDSIIVQLEDSTSIVDNEYVESFKMEHLFLKRDFAACVAVPTTADNTWHGDSVRYFMIRGQAYDELGQIRRARNYYDSARTILETRIDRGSTTAEDYTALGRIYAFNGDTAFALRIAGQGYNMLPMSKDAIAGAFVAEDYAKVLASTRHPGDAVAILDTLMHAPSHLNLVNIKQDAAWDPIKDHPSFQALIEKYETKRNLKGEA